MQTSTYYISSGRKNAMYTLRVHRQSYSNSTYHGVDVDNYICNLSTDAELAEEKARDYFDRMVDRIKPDGVSFKMIFQGYADFDLFERRGKLSVRDTENMELLEQGIMPIGKRRGQVIADMPMNTILWWADESKNTSDEGVFSAVCDVCMGIAMDKGYIAKREQIAAERDQERQKQKELSDYVGEAKQRLELSGKVLLVTFLGATQVAWNTFSERYLTKIQCGDNIIVSFGNKVAEQGDEIEFKATVKEHQEYEGMKQTVVQRIKVLSVKEKQ